MPAAPGRGAGCSVGRARGTPAQDERSPPVRSRYDHPVPGQRPRFYGQPSDHDPLEWSWVDGQLLAAGIYWVVAGSDEHLHPRRALAVDARVTVHLESGTDVVIMEGRSESPCDDDRVIAAYDQKYDWSYDIAEYGPLTAIAPLTVLAWQVAGWRGGESFQRSGRWEFAE
jgi:hypothetical protein